MKTFNEIVQEISALEDEGLNLKNKPHPSDSDNRRMNKIRKTLSELRLIRDFLKENPLPQNLETHLNTLSKQREFITNEDNFKKWLHNNPGSSNDVKKSKTQYHKELNLSHINNQIRTLKYILG